MIREGDKVLLYGEDGSKIIITVEKGKKKGTHLGHVNMDDLIGKEYGDLIFFGKKQRAFYILPPTFIDLIFNMKRRTQIIYPKDASYILFKLDVKPGSEVIDTGVGSGAMCGAFARVVGKEGKVYGYERREDFYNLAKKNLENWGLNDFVELKLRDISQGFDETNVDALLLDVPDPDNYIEKCWQALKGGGKIGIICPTTNQVQQVLEKLYDYPFIDVEVWENLMRRFKPNPERLRPFDRMVAHTTYLVFATKVLRKIGGVSDE
ncbi:SAM-dependent methyltransferase [Thermosipho melanesiensis]|uniref:tRNA (adenine(58)-N(1))-methyltransferase TrmI n=2 Tax=Thermosipho melanesiensis TaxID=46541 RepID=A6LJJ8_THEM4|nr:tRNA (adenine-N1)-methyltransferase [Thermosipho melanesiensis]ABR30099.1 tRNA methyltransferase complex GCD14 subunit [Thermosipho melanesiensis BI429]APT73296.1 SAM-dependent methyltransferase [Thermosipho melanesiensis]OOC38687.1 SAM-dependent methyltransferase [Thermosipho melanesiensis]OOC40491.1 SAM-dependent methyltransferase [Thermosipho melanesiensis]OOC40756.1 SAM-dependent methyltransferase [Thermosipho melanesiensis]